MQVLLVWITLMADEDPFFAACRKGETEQVRVALSEGEDPNKVDQNGNPAVVLAAGAGHLDVHPVARAGQMLGEEPLAPSWI